MEYDRDAAYEEFRREVARHLEPFSADLVGVLGKLIRSAYPPRVVRIEFDIFDDGFGRGFPVRAYFFDANYDEVFVYRDGKAEYPCDVDPGLLDIPRVYPAELAERYTAADEDFDDWRAAGDTLIDWFARCWRKAGGETFTRGADIGIHDDARRFDLVRGAWNDSAKAAD